jgi:ATP-binding cassette subfamily B protein
MEKKTSKKNVFDIKLLRRIFTFTQPYKNKFYTAIFLSVLLAVMAPLRPLLIIISINEGIIDSPGGYLLKGPGAFLIEVTIFQIVFLLIESLTRFYFSFSTASLGQSVVKDLRNLTYNKILNLNLTQFDRTPIGTLTTRTINDIESELKKTLELFTGEIIDVTPKEKPKSIAEIDMDEELGFADVQNVQEMSTDES